MPRSSRAGIPAPDGARASFARVSTAQLAYRVRAPADMVGRPRVERARAPLALATALLLLVLYAAFQHGAVATAPDARIQVAIAAVAAFAAGSWLWTGTLRFAAPAPTYLALTLLAGFAVWSGISLAWSVAPEGTWTELNHAITYVIVLSLAITAGASLEHAVERITKGFLIVAVAVAVYALGAKVLPGLHVSGVFNLNQTGPLSRLQAPLGYWNALALFVALALPGALALAVDVAQAVRTRIASLCALDLIVLVLAFTYSRGGVLAAVVAVAVGISLGGSMLRSLMWLAIGALAALPPMLFGLIDHSLASNGASLSARETAGLELGLIVLASLAALTLIGRLVIARERAMRPAPRRTRQIERALIALAAVAVIAGVLALALSSRGLTGTISHEWRTFTNTHEASPSNPSRLLSADSANRWVWWKEAAGAFTDRPITGWGAGSFPVVHLLYRRDNLSVQQPHSVPLQFLAETGIVGALLALGAFLLLTIAAVKTTLRRTGRERLLAAGLLAAAVCYFLHLLYDWDWDIPAVTLPALLLLGVLLGSGARTPLQRMPTAGARLRLTALVAATLFMCTFALSAALPSLAATKAADALVSAAGGTHGALQRAQADAALASRLDPLSDAGLKVESTIALRRGDYQGSRSYLLSAVGRDPSDSLAWASLVYTDFALGDLDGAARAAGRAFALDPKNSFYYDLASILSQRASYGAAPPQRSPTAVQTPR